MEYNNQLMQNRNDWTAQGGLANAAQVPAQPGVASKASELQQVVSETQELAYKLKCSLGISSPPTDAKAPTQPSSLAEVLGDLRNKLSRANCEISEAITHLNS